jgi:hypothetical protein
MELIEEYTVSGSPSRLNAFPLTAIALCIYLMRKESEKSEEVKEGFSSTCEPVLP